MLMTTDAETPPHLRPAPLPEPHPDGLRWYFVRCYAGAEWQTYKGLHKRGIDAFLPWRIEDARLTRWTQGVVKPIFKGYLCAGLETGQDTDDIKATPGALHVVRVGEQLRQITVAEMDRLRLQAADEMLVSFGAKAKVFRANVGDWVPLPTGVLAGQDGVPVEIEAIDKRGEIIVGWGPGTLSFPRSALENSM